ITFHMRSVDIDPPTAESKGGGKLGEIGRRLCCCCISKGNKLRPVELTKADAITNQPALSNISVLKKGMLNEQDNEAELYGSETNVAGSGVVSKANGDISPLTAKKLKEDCSNVTTVVLDDLIGTSGGDDQTKNIQKSVDEQLAYAVEDSNAYDVQRIVQKSWGTNEKREGKYERRSSEGKDSAAFITNIRPNFSSPIADHCPGRGEENRCKALLCEEKDDISEMEDITDMLFEITSQSNEGNAFKNSQNTPQKSIGPDSQARTEVLAQQPPLSNQKQTTGITGYTVTGIDSSVSDSDSDRYNDLDSHRRRDSNIAYVELNGAKSDELLDQHIPIKAVRRAHPFSSSLDSEGMSNRSSENHKPLPINPLQKSAASMRLNHTENLDSNSDLEVNEPTESEIRNSPPRIEYTANHSQQSRVLADSSRSLKMQNANCHTHDEMDKAKQVSPLQRPTRMYASSSSSSDADEEVEQDQNVTRLSVKSNGEATIKSTTSNGEVVSVQLACASDHQTTFS
uniref:Uncharacterized protein n=1 Tax=Parascaris univalens TaxID=6257 RepID=A0A914ZKG2_PARUN